ncbi:hypothetical protein RMCBS344292_00964 [Rhizopus microsporus]|nr:hypothetical protein RMCBS344292_00964 [Rhizopus microsporus]
MHLPQVEQAQNLMQLHFSIIKILGNPHMTTAASATIVSPTLSSFQCSSIYHPTHELNFTEGAQFTATTNTTTTTTSTTSPSNNTHTNTITTTNTNKNNTQSMTYSPHKEDNVYAPQLTPQSTSSWFQLPKYNLSPKLSDSTCYYNHHHSHNQHKKSPPKQTVHAESIPGPNIRNFISFKTIDSMPLESHHSQQAYFSSRAR